MIHELKIRAPFATAIVEGRKTFEVRYNDRGFNVGDLIEFKPINEDDTSIRSHAIINRFYKITYVISGWGLKDNWVAFGIEQEDVVEMWNEMQETPDE